MRFAGVFQPEIMSSSSIESWVEFWSVVYAIAKLPNREVAPANVASPWNLLLLAPKQLLLLAQSTSARQSWTHVTWLTIQLLKKDLINCREVQEQALAVVRQDWPQVIITCFITSSFWVLRSKLMKLLVISKAIFFF